MTGRLWNGTEAPPATAADSETRRRRAALAILREGRCTIRLASGPPEWDPGVDTEPQTVLAVVQSSRLGGPMYAIDRTPRPSEPGVGDWYCTCREQSECAHVAAVKLVTGWAS